jgi:hypothetical protein
MMLYNFECLGKGVFFMDFPGEKLVEKMILENYGMMKNLQKMKMR